MGTTKVCTKCGVEKPLGEFYKRSHSPDGLTPMCKSCVKITNQKPQYKNRQKLYQRRRRSEEKKIIKLINNRCYQKLRDDIFNHYGRACTCCGENNIKFLCIDHINGGGNKHREKVGGSGSKTYQWLRKNNYPKGFQVLCHNCNMAKGLYGECPHETERKSVVKEAKHILKTETVFTGNVKKKTVYQNREGLEYVSKI